MDNNTYLEFELFKNIDIYDFISNYEKEYEYYNRCDNNDFLHYYNYDNYNYNDNYDDDEKLYGFTDDWEEYYDSIYN